MLTNTNTIARASALMFASMLSLATAVYLTPAILPFSTEGGTTAFAAEEKEAAHDHEHDHEAGEHPDHEMPEFLYGNHLCPGCEDHDPVDPHYFLDVKNKKDKIYGRVYLCAMECAQELKTKIADVYNKLYRTDRKTGEKIEPRDLKNPNCPMSGDPVDGKTTIEYNGMIVGFCCAECVEAFVKDPEPGMAKILPKAKEFKFEAGKEGHEAHGEHGAHEGHEEPKGNK